MKPLPPAEMYEKGCKKPCYDCPLTREGAIYQSPQELTDNIHRTLVQRTPQHCHHSLMDTSAGTVLLPEKSRPRVCGGHLVLMRKLGIRPPDGRVPEHLFLAAEDRDRRVVDSIEEFVRIGSTLCQLPRSRYWMWWALQPAHVRLRIMKEEIDAGIRYCLKEKLG